MMRLIFGGRPVEAGMDWTSGQPMIPLWRRKCWADAEDFLRVARSSGLMGMRFRDFMVDCVVEKVVE